MNKIIDRENIRSENIRSEIIISGRVQKAGYKDFIDEAAFGLNINGNVKNLDDGTVQVVCEGQKDDIKEFISKINVSKYPIRVEKIDDKYTTPTGEFKTFEIIRDEDLTMATYERMDSAVRYMREMNSNLGEKIDILREDTNENFKKMDDNFSRMDMKYDAISKGLFALVDVIEKRQQSFDIHMEKIDKNIETLLEILARKEVSTTPA